MHHNTVTANASIGDALYSGTPSAAGGVTFCTGADGYTLNHNWVCGNLSTGDGGGVAHSGFINDGTITNNWILFNQSQSPTIPTNGGGLAVLGASPDRTILTGPNAGQECGGINDQDCPPGLPEGTGRNLVIDANLIMGNSAESGTGGGLRLQMVNGQEVPAFPLCTPPTARFRDGLHHARLRDHPGRAPRCPVARAGHGPNARARRPPQGQRRARHRAQLPGRTPGRRGDPVPDLRRPHPADIDEVLAVLAAFEGRPAP